VPITQPLTGDDLEQLDHNGAGEPAAVAADLVAAVDAGNIADPADIPYALGIAVHKLEAAGDVEAALALADRAVEAERRLGDATAGWQRANRARLLTLAGRADDAVEEASALRPLLLEDPDAASYVTDVLREAGRGELAERWLTEALTTALGWGDDIDDGKAAVTYQLAACRHALRHELDVPHDDLDDLADELRDAADGEAAADGSVVMFWPRDEFDALLRRLPAVAGSEGSSWDEHRDGIEVTLAQWAAAGTTGLAVVAGSVDELVAYAERAGVAPDDDEAVDGYVESLDLPERLVPWPPPRNGPCWCGSDLKYKKCCLPRSRS
jgi:tetratricopeptide (TPR) repeat protein